MATDNTAYYAAEEALRAKIARMPVEETVSALHKASRLEGCEFNRILFRYFDVVEENTQ